MVFFGKNVLNNQINKRLLFIKIPYNLFFYNFLPKLTKFILVYIINSH